MSERRHYSVEADCANCGYHWTVDVRTGELRPTTLSCPNCKTFERVTIKAKGQW